MFSKLGVQLYSVRDCLNDEKDCKKTFDRLVSLGYTEAQTAGNMIENPEFAKAASESGMKIVGTHYDYAKIINQPEYTMEIHRRLGTVNVGIGGMPAEARKDYRSLMEFISKFNSAAEIYAKNGFKLTYHNHSFEFVRICDNKTVMDFLYEGLDKNNVSFVLDTCWVAHGGADVRYWIEKLKNRIDILHLKDIKAYFAADGSVTQKYTEIGNGNIYWDGVMAAAEDCGVTHYVVEQDSDWIEGDPFISLKVSRDYLDKYLSVRK